VSEDTTSLITLGSINGIYGVKGWVKVFSFTDPKENILEYKTWRLKKNNQWFTCTLEAGKSHGKGIIAKLEGFDGRDEVAKLMKSEIMVSRDELPGLPKGEYYWSDLEGLEVVNLEEVSLGHIDHMVETGADDVIVVKGKEERLIPFVQEVYVKKVDLENKVLIVDWPEEFDAD